jgi:hypothetical protein
VLGGLYFDPENGGNGGVRSSETSGNLYLTTRRHVPENSRPHVQQFRPVLCCGTASYCQGGNEVTAGRRSSGENCIVNLLWSSGNDTVLSGRWIATFRRKVVPQPSRTPHYYIEDLNTNLHGSETSRHIQAPAAASC